LLAAATSAAARGSGVAITRVKCLANCNRGASAAMRANGSWTYIFGELDQSCGHALIEGVRMLADAADGILPWRGRPEVLKGRLIARVPPLDFVEDPE
jgi:predicted metal-binding protein